MTSRWFLQIHVDKMQQHELQTLPLCRNSLLSSWILVICASPDLFSAYSKQTFSHKKNISVGKLIVVFNFVMFTHVLYILFNLLANYSLFFLPCSSKLMFSSKMFRLCTFMNALYLWVFLRYEIWFSSKISSKISFKVSSIVRLLIEA